MSPRSSEFEASVGCLESLILLPSPQVPVVLLLRIRLKDYISHACPFLSLLRFTGGQIAEMHVPFGHLALDSRSMDETCDVT